MQPRAQVLRFREQVVPSLDGMHPVVRVQPVFSSFHGSPGTGFFIDQWSSWLITARHVVMHPNGSPPDAVAIAGWVGEQEVTLEGTAVAFLPHTAAADVAVVRVRAAVQSPLSAAEPPAA